MCFEPGLGDAFLRPREPGLDNELLQLIAHEAREVGDAHQDGGVAVEVRRGEEHAALVGEQELLHTDVRDAEHQDVVEPLARLRIDRVAPAAAMEAEHLPVDEVRRPPVLGNLFGRLRQGERELVQVGHRAHGTDNRTAQDRLGTLLRASPPINLPGIGTQREFDLWVRERLADWPSALVQDFERWLIDEGRFEFVPSVQEAWRQRDAEADAGEPKRKLIGDLVVRLEGVVQARELAEDDGASVVEIAAHTAEIERLRAQLEEATAA
jgi:hypothetical protein